MHRTLSGLARRGCDFLLRLTRECAHTRHVERAAVLFYSLSVYRAEIDADSLGQSESRVKTRRLHERCCRGNVRANVRRFPEALSLKFGRRRPNGADPVIRAV